MAFSGDLSPKLELIDRCPKSPLLNMDIQFDDLRECTSEIFQKAFIDAWKVRVVIRTLAHCMKKANMNKEECFKGKAGGKARYVELYVGGLCNNIIMTVL